MTVHRSFDTRNANNWSLTERHQRKPRLLTRRPVQQHARTVRCIQWCAAIQKRRFRGRLTRRGQWPPAARRRRATGQLGAWRAGDSTPRMPGLPGAATTANLCRYASRPLAGGPHHAGGIPSFPIPSPPTPPPPLDPLRRVPCPEESRSLPRSRLRRPPTPWRCVLPPSRWWWRRSPPFSRPWRLSSGRRRGAAWCRRRRRRRLRQCRRWGNRCRRTPSRRGARQNRR